MVSKGTVGIVTVTYNSADVLEGFKRSLFEQSYGQFRLFAVDNASKDGTTRLLQEWADGRVTVITNDENVGVAEANNQGIRSALDIGCETILLINNDTVFEQDLLQKLLDGLHALSCEMIAPKMLFFDPPNRIWAAGGSFQPWRAFDTTHYGFDQVDSAAFDRAREVTYVPTCCVLITATVFRQIGLMDPTYFVYMDDVDFMFRAHKARLRLMYLPTAKLWHKIGHSSGGPASTLSVFYTSRNRAYFIRKHFPVAIRFLLLMFYPALWFSHAVRRKEGWHVFRSRISSYFVGLRLKEASTNTH